MMLLIMAVGVGAWALGRTQTDGGPGPGGGGPDPGSGAGAHPSGNGYANGPAPGHQPGAQTGHQPGPGSMPGAGHAGGDPPRSSWQRPTPGATGASTNNNTQSNTGANTNTRPNTSMPNNAAKGAWEKAREETKRKEEERKAKEAEKKRKEDLEKRLKEMREKDAREREAREKLAKEKAEREAREARLKEAEEKLKAQGDSKPKGSTYAYSAVGEKTNPWPRGQPASPAARSQPSSPTKKPPAPTAKTYLGTEEDAYSYRPYDKPKKPMHKKSHSSLYSESSYAASQSTSRTTPPPSNRGPYSTKDPDKIVIKAVYAFNNAFLKTPTSQLVSGVGSVTDGLILRITTEGLFIDDDVRGVPQREWDVKAWTMKLVEVWCPSFRQGPAGTSARVASYGSPHKHNPVRRLWGLDKEKAATSEETDALLVEMMQLCKDNCRFRASSAASPSVASSSVYSASSVGSSDERSESSFASSYASSVGSSSPSYKRRTDNRGAHQTGELKSARLHVLRASIRDQEGKKFVFIVTEEESWKISVGLQRLRKGSLVRAFGVSGMSANDARSTLENLGWA